MAIVEKKMSIFASYRGSPTSLTAWNMASWDFDAKNVKVILAQGSGDLEISLDGESLHCKLPAPVATQNAMVYDFPGLGVSRMFLRGTAAVVELYAYGVN